MTKSKITDIHLDIWLKAPDKESLLDEISDIQTADIMSHYPLIKKVLGGIKNDVVKHLKEGD